MLNNKNILVIGGAGFVGSNLVKYLSKKNSLFVLDNYFTGKKKNHVKGVKYYAGKTDDINSIFFKNNFDIIFHLGEYSRVEQSFKDIDKVIEFNTKPFYQVIKFAKNKNAKIIYSGSSTKYASYNTHNSLISPYAWSKISNINLLKNYANWFKLNYAITYFYNVYGDNEIDSGKYATVVGKFIKLKKNKKKYVQITKPGTQKRNFTHVNDVISALELVALYGNGDGYGIGSNKSFSIVELADMVGIKYKFVSEKLGNRMDGALKTNKTKKLGWTCNYDLKEYIKNKVK